MNDCPAHPTGMRPPDRQADVEQWSAAGADKKAADAEGPSAERAAECYAAGMTAYDLATDPAGYRSAIAFFDRAVGARPQFAAAYLARGEAYYSSGSIPAAAKRLGRRAWSIELDPAWATRVSERLKVTA